MKELTKGQKKDYLATSHICPYCGDTDLEADHCEVDANGACQPVQCLSCGREWQDVYELVDIEEVRK